LVKAPKNYKDHSERRARPRNAHDFSSHFGEAKWKCERDQLWEWIERIALLAEKVIKWCKHFGDLDCKTDIITMDGVDFRSWEEKHPTRVARFDT
jgi:hypothetical protein